MPFGQAQTNILGEAAQPKYSFVGSLEGSISPAISGCPQAGPCAGWFGIYSNWADIFTWADGTTSGQTHPVGGMILNGYNWFGAANGFGFPLTDELDTPYYTGRYQAFQGGNIYYKWNAAGSYEVGGWIGIKYSNLGTTTSALGFPTGNESNYVNGSIHGRYNTFEYGVLIWDGDAGSWQADTWPVFTVPTASTRSGAWIVGRPVSTTAPSYDLQGCGFTRSAQVTVFVNNMTQQSFLTTAVTDATGCFEVTTPTIPGAFDNSNVATFEAADTNGYRAAVGVGWGTATDCFASKSDVGPINYYMVARSAESIWCVDPNFWKPSKAQLLAYDYLYPDKLIGQLQADLGGTFQGPVTVRVGPKADSTNTVQTDCFGASTDAGTLAPAGVQIPQGCFDDPYQAPNGDPTTTAWASIYIMQEITNTYTGQVTGGGWPTDWWADHKSPFPTFVNWSVLGEVSTAANSIDLADASAIEFAYNHGTGPGGNASVDSDPYYDSGYGPNWDPQTLLFAQVKASGGGWQVFAKMFQLMREDGIDFGNGAFTNPSELLSEYVVAYMSLALGADYTAVASAYGVGERPYYYDAGVKLDCWLQYAGGAPVAGCASVNYVDATKQTVQVNTRPWPGYTLQSANVVEIADAHCAVSTGYPVALQALQDGVPGAAIQLVQIEGGEVSSCPSECVYSPTTLHCTAPWH